LEGDIIETKPVGLITQSQLETAALSFKGELVQTPPVFSAKKINGKPAYYYARNDTGHEQLKRLKTSNVSIYDIEIKSFNGLDGIMSVCCSSGTYIRSIVNDLGKLLGCGATLTHLTRDSIGKFELTDSINVDDIEKIVDGIGKNTGDIEKIAAGAAGSVDGTKRNADGAEKREGGIENIATGDDIDHHRAGIISVEKILQLKYL
jgi:tRNA U55 pseudouridine synthase TruB